MNIELVELSSDMMCGACVNVPICVYTIGTFGLLWWIFIITIAQPVECPSFLATPLRLRTRPILALLLLRRRLLLEGMWRTVGGG
jgi:hypothetical protein